MNTQEEIARNIIGHSVENMLSTYLKKYLMDIDIINIKPNRIKQMVFLGHIFIENKCLLIV